MVFEKTVERRQERIADRLHFPGRVEQFQERWQHGDAGGEGHQHADAGDLAEFRNALVVGRQEREESGRGGHRGERQRHRRALGRLYQRRRQIVALEALRAVADAVLNAEIHAQADEQDGERDRKQVQRSHHHQAGGGGDGKADEEIGEHREDDLRRMQRHPENEQHDDDGADPVPDGAVLDGREFLVGDRNRPGQPDPRAIFAGEMEVVGRLPDGVGRSLARAPAR